MRRIHDRPAACPFPCRRVACAILALVVLALLSLGCADASSASTGARVVGGVFDAEGVSFDERAVALAGEWRVHWPEDPSFDGPLRVPSRLHEERHPVHWEDASLRAEFTVELRNLPRREPLALFVGRLFPTVTTCTDESGHRLVSGRNGSDATHSSSQLGPYVALLPDASNVRCTLTLFVSTERQGGRPGLWTAPRVGTARAAFRQFDEERVRDAAFTAMLLTLGGFFFFQWLLRRDEQLALFVAAFNGAAAVWHTGYSHLLDAEPIFTPILRSRIEYAAVPLLGCLGFGTALRIAPTSLRQLERGVVVATSIAVLALFLVPATGLHAVLHAVQPVVLATTLAGLAIAIRALLSRGATPDTRLAAAGLLFPAVCGIVDVVASILTLGVSSTLGFGMFLLAVCLALVLAQRNARARRSAEIYGEATRRFVPTEFLHALGHDDVTGARLGQATGRELTMVFADIRGFTTICEELSPGETFRLLNDCFACVGPPIREYGGFVDKYIGDAVMALFQESPADAVRAAVAIQETLRHANEAGAFHVPIEIGIGIHVGHVMMGTVGEEQRFEATVISDAVNTTARIEGFTKLLGCSIVVSAEVAQHLHGEDRAFSRSLGRFALKGKTRAVELVEVFTADAPELREAKRRARRRFEEATEAMLDGRREIASALFAELSAEVPGDGPLHWWCKQCEAQLSAPESTVRSGAMQLRVKA